MDVTQYYMRDPPIVSNNNIWLSCTGIAYIDTFCNFNGFWECCHVNFQNYRKDGDFQLPPNCHGSVSAGFYYISFHIHLP